MTAACDCIPANVFDVVLPSRLCWLFVTIATAVLGDKTEIPI